MSTTQLLTSDDPHTLPPALITGRRGTARIDLARSEIRNVAFSPVEAFRSIHLQVRNHRSRSQIYTNHLIHHLFFGSERSLEISFCMAREGIWMAMLLQSNSDQPIEIKFTVEPSLDYIHKFQGRGSHTLHQSKQRITFTQLDHPELMAYVKSTLPLQTSATQTQTQTQQILSFNIDRPGVIFWGGGYRDQVENELEALDYDAAVRELHQVIEAEERWIDQGAQLVCPDPDLNRFFQLSRSWFHKSIRRLPFGSPYQTDLQENQEIDVVSASPDYHGVFANDCIQSSLEGMIVAPDLKDCYQNGLEALYHHAHHLGDQIPESIELIHGDRRIYYALLRIGQHPEWIVSLASLVLLSGDRDLGKELWSGVQLALRYFVDPWQVGLNVWDTSAYPEQPDTRGYQFGRVYAQAWWIWALQLASELAGYLGYDSEADQLKQSADQASAALERYFAREDGYGSWLSEKGDLHPHQDHEVIIPIALGLAPPARAQRVIETILSPSMWMDPYGPRRSNLGSNLGGGDWVWGFMRWNFIQALFQYDRADQAQQLAAQWAKAEIKSGLRASEVFSHRTATGITGEGYVWTAARASRAISYGLLGIRLRQDGLELDPKLPRSWPEMSFLNLPFRGKILDIIVQRGDRSNQLNGQDGLGSRIRELDLDRERNQLHLYTR